jgi:hypothetical protein
MAPGASRMRGSVPTNDHVQSAATTGPTTPPDLTAARLQHFVRGGPERRPSPRIIAMIIPLGRRAGQAFFRFPECDSGPAPNGAVRPGEPIDVPGDDVFDSGNAIAGQRGTKRSAPANRSTFQRSLSSAAATDGRRPRQRQLGTRITRIATETDIRAIRVLRVQLPPRSSARTTRIRRRGREDATTGNRPYPRSPASFGSSPRVAPRSPNVSNLS